jgi:hypothetical protein
MIPAQRRRCDSCRAKPARSSPSRCQVQSRAMSYNLHHSPSPFWSQNLEDTGNCGPTSWIRKTCRRRCLRATSLGRGYGYLAKGACAMRAPASTATTTKLFRSLHGRCIQQSWLKGVTDSLSGIAAWDAFHQQGPNQHGPAGVLHTEAMQKRQCVVSAGSGM